MVTQIPENTPSIGGGLLSSTVQLCSHASRTPGDHQDRADSTENRSERDRYLRLILYSSARLRMTALEKVSRTSRSAASNLGKTNLFGANHTQPSATCTISMHRHTYVACLTTTRACTPRQVLWQPSGDPEAPCQPHDAQGQRLVKPTPQARCVVRVPSLRSQPHQGQC